jgi:hypothetical protein
MMLSSSAVVGCVDTDWKPRRISSPLESWSPAAPGELSTQSEEFRTRWAAHNVRLHQTGAKHVHHPVVGDLSLTFEMLELGADPGLTILTYTAQTDLDATLRDHRIDSLHVALDLGVRPLGDP